MNIFSLFFKYCKCFLKFLLALAVYINVQNAEHFCKTTAKYMAMERSQYQYGEEKPIKIT